MVYIGSIPAPLQRKRTTRSDNKTKITKKHETRPRSMPCSAVGAGDRLVVALFPLAAIGGALAVETTAGGHRWARGRACGRRNEPSRAKGKFGEQLGCGAGGHGCGRRLRSRRYRLPRAHDRQPAAPAPDILTVHGPRQYRR